MKKCTIFIVVMILIGARGVFAQGFVNLDFENANLSSYSAGSVPAADAVPGWTAYIGGTPMANISYDASASSQGGVEVDILGPDSGYPAIQGNYFVFIQGGSGALNSASIGQTGTIPVTAQSLILSGNIFGSPVSFNGQTLSLSRLGHTANYNIYGVDISAFAGQTGQLLFTSTLAAVAGGDTIDNIQFSSSPIPEPGVVGLFSLGGLGLLWHRRKANVV